MKPPSDSQTKNEKMFSQQHSAAGKAVERVLGELFSRFQILYRPARMLNKEDLNMIIKACCVIQDMGCESRKESHTRTTNVA